jgi:hypothetical protein
MRAVRLLIVLETVSNVGPAAFSRSDARCWASVAVKASAPSSAMAERRVARQARIEMTSAPTAIPPVPTVARSAATPVMLATFTAVHSNRRHTGNSGE